MGHKILRSIYIDVDQLNRLKELAVETNRTQASFYREAVEEILERYKHVIDAPQLTVVKNDKPEKED